jgi:hypothetical protein
VFVCWLALVVTLAARLLVELLRVDYSRPARSRSALPVSTLSLWSRWSLIAGGAGPVSRAGHIVRARW